MSNQQCAVIRLTLFRESERSFLDALDKASIPYQRIEQFSVMPQNSGILACISAVATAMPWNAIAEVIIAWINAKKSREVIIQTEDGKVVNIKGYSAKDVQALLKVTYEISAIDTKKEK